jgi:hypothetical protein
MRFALCVLMLAGCEDLSFAPNDGGVVQVVNTENADGTTTSRVDSRDEKNAFYFDLESKQRVESSNPNWDLSLLRYKIAVNGGASGSGGVEVALLPSTDFDAVQKAPSSGWISDAPDSPTDDDDEVDRSFHVGEGWYVYDITGHTLTARDIVYVVKSHEGNYYKLKMLSYYDPAGTPGFPTFKWKKIDAPSGNDTIVVDASAMNVWTYVSAKSGVIAAPATPETSNAWDLAFSRRQIRTNSGSSGAGLGGAQTAPAGSVYGTLITSGTTGFRSDAAGSNPVLDGWTENAVFLVRTAAGDYTKLTVVSWTDGVFGIKWAPLLRQVGVKQLTVDANAIAYVSLRLAETVTVADPATSREWDLSFLADKVRTNGGGSGGGQGAAADPMESELGSIVNATPWTFVTDTAAGNALLDGWHETDLTPKDKVYVIRLADGGYAKLKIGIFMSGSYTLFWSYAGAGRADF